MKNLKFIVAFVFVMMLSYVTAYGGVNTEDVTVMPIHNTSKFYVSFAENVESQKVTVKIKSETGHVIYTDKVFTDKTIKVYNMEKCAKGTFLIEIIGTDFQLTKSVEIGKLAGFDARLEQKNDQLELVYLNHDADLDIYLKDEANNILYYGTGKMGKYRQTFDVTDLPNGNYTLQVTNGEQVFVETFQVK